MKSFELLLIAYFGSSMALKMSNLRAKTFYPLSMLSSGNSEGSSSSSRSSSKKSSSSSSKLSPSGGDKGGQGEEDDGKIKKKGESKGKKKGRGIGHQDSKEHHSKKQRTGGKGPESGEGKNNGSEDGNSGSDGSQAKNNKMKLLHHGRRTKENRSEALRDTKLGRSMLTDRLDNSSYLSGNDESPESDLVAGGNSVESSE